MKNMILLCVLFLLSGCKLFPTKPDFPKAPDLLMEPCPDLSTIGKFGVPLSDYTKTVVGNYTKYHVCAGTVEGWQIWYTEQKKIYESTK